MDWPEKHIICSLFMAVYPLLFFSQEIEGRITHAFSGEPLEAVEITLDSTEFYTYSDQEGKFYLSLSNDLAGNYILTISLDGYITQRYPLYLTSGQGLNLGQMVLQPDLDHGEDEMALITLSDSELEEEGAITSTISGLLTSTNDVFYNAAAYDFGTTFFSIRGLNNRYQKQLVNGIALQEFSTGMPEWGSFGGINDVMRNQEFSPGLSAAKVGFGGINGTVNTTVRASQYRKGGKIAFAQSNRSYRQRFIASYGSGEKPGGWFYAFLLSRRMGSHGYKAGTRYEAQSIFVAVEKKLGAHHSLNFTGFYTPNKRGKSTILTKEVKALKGMHYNPLWGKQGNRNRNSRIKEVKRPLLMLNHYWTINDKIKLQTNLAYQFGTIGNTRIDNGGTRIIETVDGQKAYVGGARNPTPEYYQNLPSYFLRDDQPDAFDFQKAYLAEEDFKRDGQLNWASLYEANATAMQKGGNAVYAVQEDVENNRQITLNSIGTGELNDHAKATAGVRYVHLRNQNYARVEDLLGAEGFLDIDFYAEEPNETVGIISDLAQSDLNQPDRIVQEGDRYKYNYDINVLRYSGFGQVELSYKKVDLFAAGELSQTTYQREGKYKNGYFPESSFGKGEKLSFTDFGLKMGGLYKLTGQHMFRLNAGYLTKAPVIRNAFPNPRQNGIPVIDLQSEKVLIGDISYIFRNPLIKARVTGFYSTLTEGSEVGFFFTQGLSGMGQKHDAAFVQEVTTGIGWRNLGVEYGIEVKATPTIILKAAGSFRRSVYTRNAQLYLTSEDFKTSLLHGEQRDFAEKHEGVPLIFGEGKTKLKNYHPAVGPEKAFQFGLEYRDPSYWFVGTTANFFGDAYVGINKLRRSANFSRDVDGLPLNDYDPKRAQELLQQERLGNYMLLNLVGGKSWKIKQYYVGFFGVVSNLLNQEYRSGGFESGRKASYMEFNRDQSAPYGPQFGNRYFYGYGTTFYFNIYFRF